ncbi:hypothetical protein OAI48_00205 [Candidatus Pelagibacter sp.]|nr:hypothetical protein [Candidatus Pelagibacter sp.]
MNKVKVIVIFFSILMLTSCATPHVVSVVGPNDNSMSCSELSNEIGIASKFKRDAKAEKSLGTTTNVGAILFWLPGVVATQMNANEAIRAADDRINHLNRLKSKKNCD